MEPVETLPTGAVASEDVDRRSDRLLHSMHQVFSHDLPNQLVVINSLIALLELEEGARLEPDGREQLRRLGSAARKASSMVFFLQDMARLRTLQEPIETVPVQRLLREVQAQLARRFPHLLAEHRETVVVEVLRAGRGTLQQALLLMAGLGLGAESVGRAEWDWTIHSVAAGAEIRCRRRDSPPAAPARPEGEKDWLLARESAATWGGKLRWEMSAEGGILMVLTIPEPHPHG